MGTVENGESCILDVRVTDTDAKSYRGSTSAKVLEKVAREKRAKYEKACLEQWRSFIHGACLLSRWNGWQGCQSLRKTDRQSACGQVEPGVQFCRRVGQGANGSCCCAF